MITISVLTLVLIIFGTALLAALIGMIVMLYLSNKRFREYETELIMLHCGSMTELFNKES